LTDVLASPPRRLPDPGFHLLDWKPIPLWRLHHEADPLRPRRFRTGKYRFDAPRDGHEYHVLYASVDERAPFAEVYGDTQLISANEATRRNSRIVAARQLQLVDLTDAHVQKVLRIDGRIATAKQYPTTQKWSRALHRWFPDADGIIYPSRHAGPHHNLCLFLDRCRTELDVQPVREIGEPAFRLELLDICDLYNLVLMIPRP
jgi:hypothetical protein